MTSTGLSDKFGREIKVGDMVVYPMRRRSEIMLNAATVTGAGFGYLVADKLEGNVQVKLRHPKRCAIVEV